MNGLKKTDNNGFTIVELIVVLVVLGILAAIITPSLLGYIDKAKERQNVLHAKSVYTAAQTVLTEKYGKAYPLEGDNLSKVAEEIALIADATAMGCDAFTIVTGDTFEHAKAEDSSLAVKHAAYTVYYICYEEGGEKQYVTHENDGSSKWETEKPDIPNGVTISWSK